MNKKLGDRVKIGNAYGQVIVELSKVERPLKIETINCNNKRVTNVLSYDDFLSNDTILVESGTGTGKSKCFAIYVAKYLKENPGKKLISIFGKRNLGMAQKLYFLENGIDVSYYSDNGFHKNCNGNVLICINSLYKYIDQFTSNSEDYVLFLDEISLFTCEITHNETLGELKKIYAMLKFLIRKCDKLFACQNEINDSATELLKVRLKQSRRNILIKNAFKNNMNKKAIKCLNVDIMIEKMKEDVANGKYFVFSSDSKEECDKIFELFTKDLKDKNNYVKFTSKSDDKYDDTFDFKNKYCFHTPCISAGVDISLEHPQNAYIYIKGKSVDSVNLYQMAMRTRNLNKLFYSYRDKIKVKEPKFKSVQDCYDELANDVKTNNKSVLNMCYNLNIDDEMAFKPNTFFDLYVRNEYLTEKYHANLIQEFENILINNGFEVVLDIVKTTDYTIEMKKAKDNLTVYSDNVFTSFLETGENESLSEICNILHTSNMDDKLRFQEFIKDEFKLRGHFNFVKVFSQENYIKRKLAEYDAKLFDVKLITNTYNKILHLKNINKKHKIDLLDINANRDDDIVLNESELNTLKSVFRFSGKINKKHDLIKFIVGQINTLCNCDVYTSKRVALKGVRLNNYVLNEEEMHKQFNLYRLRNNCVNIEPCVLDFLGIEEEFDIQTVNLNDIFGE